MSGRYAAVNTGRIIDFADAVDGRGGVAWFDTQGMTPAPALGWALNADGATFSAPAAAVVVPVYAKLSKNQMRRHLFAHAPTMTPTVWASLFDPAADVSTKLYAQAYQLAETISCPLDTTDAAGAADTGQGLSILVGEGKITAGEKQAIIDNWPNV